MSNRVVVSVSNDLTTDQRVHKVCTSLLHMGFDVLVVGRKLIDSQQLHRNYSTQRFSTFFKSGPLFYFEFNIRLFFILLFKKTSILLSNDLDTLPANFFASKIKNLHLVYDSHELFPEVPELVHSPIKKKIWEAIEKFFLTRVSASYTVCDSIANFYQQKYGLKMKVVKNVPEQSEFVQEEAKDPKSIIFQGALNPGRGLDLAIDSMQYLADYKLTIVGGGQQMNNLKSLAMDLGVSDRVVFLGKIPFEELKAYTSKATVGLLLEEPIGLSFEYSLPNKLFDYIHSNVAVVATPLIEVKNVIDSFYVGELIQSRDPKQLAEQIKSISSNHNKFDFSEAQSAFNWQSERKKLKDVFNF